MTYSFQCLRHPRYAFKILLARKNRFSLTERTSFSQSSNSSFLYASPLWAQNQMSPFPSKCIMKLPVLNNFRMGQHTHAMFPTLPLTKARGGLWPRDHG
ncbi:hypothetical protein CEXT_551771 [Caerostris extrusa]|uniref:Uncharacterized protein n=1 Tax=Caerostris extrusa TaxID=172846 RepID=A0AAV4U8B0_CAEEX|nr:hypothetical protein CEXT_551771 [Caerostris extrusa]